jgi:thiol-disulfide isomerase/thioredoxin
MNRDGFIVFICLLAMLGFYMFHLGTQPPSKKDTQSLKDSIISKHRPRVIYFFSDTCGVCIRYRPVLERAIEIYGNSIDFQPVNITIVFNDPDTLNMINTFHIVGVPTTIIFDSNGEQVFAQSGFIDEITLNNVLRSIYLPTLNEPDKVSVKKL